MNGELLCLAKAGLHLDEPLTVRFVRSESNFYVADRYTVDIERETDVFNSFVRVRSLNEEAEADIEDRPVAEQDPDIIDHTDVERLISLLCEGSEVAPQTKTFMSRFDPRHTGTVTRAHFHRVLQEECDFLNLSMFERIFLTFDDPATSRLSLYTAISVMVLILISSVGFILATEAQFLERPKNTDEPPREIYSLRVVEAYCMIAFTVEYLSRGLTVWAVRLYLRESSINFTIVKKKSVSPSPSTEEELPPLPRPNAMNALPGHHITRSTSFKDPARVLESEPEPPVHNEPALPKSISWISKSLTGESKASSIKVGPEDAANNLSVELQLEQKHPFVKHSGLKRTWKYLTSTMNIIDAIAIAPFYLELVFGVGGGGLGFLRILRLARVFRLFKFGQLNEGVTLLGNVIRQSYPSLKLLAFFALIGCVLYGSIIFLCEQGSWHGPEDGEQGVWMRPNSLGTDKELTPFLSIPRSMWWVMVTATTVGYGDMVPTTSLGKVVASLTMLSGVLVLALPITIISSNFTNEYDKLEQLKSEQRLAKVNRSMHKIDFDEDKVIELFNIAEEGEVVNQREWEVLRSYQGNVLRRLERHLAMLLKGARVIALIGRLETRGAVSEASCVAVTREILSLMYKSCVKGHAQQRIVSADLTDGGNSLESGDVDAVVQVVMMWFRRMFIADARKQSSLHGTMLSPDPHPSKRAKSSKHAKTDHKGRRGSVESNMCAPPSPHKRRRSQPSLLVSPVHQHSLRAATHRVMLETRAFPVPSFKETKDPMNVNAKSKSSDSVLFGMGQFPSEPPSEEEEHELRIAFMSFIIKVIPPVSTLTKSV